MGDRTFPSTGVILRRDPLRGKREQTGLATHGGRSRQSAREIQAFPRRMSNRAQSRETRCVRPLRSEEVRVAYKPREELTKDRLHALLLATLVALVLLAWCGALIYLGVRLL